MPFNPDKRINIHNLTIEEPEQQAELPFDPERDITEEDWRGMKKWLEESRAQKNWKDFVRAAYHMKLLFPERADELRLDDEVCKSIQGELAEMHKKFGEGDFLDKKWEWKGNFYADWNDFIHFTQGAKILFAKKATDMMLEQRIFKAIKTIIQENINSSDWGSVLSNSVTAKFLFPQRTHEFDLGESEWGEIKEWYSKHTQGLNIIWVTWNMRLLFPHKFHELNWNEKDWEMANKHLQEYRVGDDKNYFIQEALRMKVLAAERVEFTDRGLEITMPKKKKSLSSNVPPLPETKKF